MARIALMANEISSSGKVAPRLAFRDAWPVVRMSALPRQRNGGGVRRGHGEPLAIAAQDQRATRFVHMHWRGAYLHTTRQIESGTACGSQPVARAGWWGRYGTRPLAGWCR